MMTEHSDGNIKAIQDGPINSEPLLVSQKTVLNVYQ